MTHFLRFLIVAAVALPHMVAAQSSEPLSAIDWLSDVIQPGAGVTAPGGETDISRDASIDDVSVTSIGAPQPDAIGLLPAHVTGFSPQLWRGSSAKTAANRLRAIPLDQVPAMQDILYRLLLAELEPPADADASAQLLLARVDLLLALGAVDQAQALTNILTNPSPELFRRIFDISLLLRQEDESCASLRRRPGLSPTFQARIYCLARSGDWSAAALSLETGRALGFVSEDEDPLLAEFLELGLADETVGLPVPSRPTPLEFRMYEAIGRPLPTLNLPRAFAHTDLHSATGWKNQIEAAERLVQTGAIDMNQLLGLYRAQRPAASGGVWDRAAAIQSLDGALLAQSPDVLGAAMGLAMQAMQEVELEVPFARAFCPKLSDRAVGPAAQLMHKAICGLAGRWDEPPVSAEGLSSQLIEIASLSGFQGAPARNLQDAIARGFAHKGVPTRLQSLVSEGRQGEALLRVFEMVESGANGDLDELVDALGFLRAIGLDDLATRTAVEIVLLDRRG